MEEESPQKFLPANRPYPLPNSEDKRRRDKTIWFSSLMQDLIRADYLVPHYKREKVGGKIRTAHAGNVIVYGDSSIYFPLLCAYVLSNCRPTEEEGNIQKEEDMDE